MVSTTPAIHLLSQFNIWPTLGGIWRKTKNNNNVKVLTLLSSLYIAIMLANYATN